MITVNDLSLELVTQSNSLFINIIIEFLNDFINTFHVLSKEEIIERINRLSYIGFNKGIYKTFDANAVFGSGIYFYIAVNEKYTHTTNDKIKAILCHELIHCLSCHYENGILKDGLCLDIDNGSIFNEIMTEYYSQILLSHQNIYNYDYHLLDKDKNCQDYIESYGIGYLLYSPLGRIYHYVYNQSLIKAMFCDNKPFIDEYNKLKEEMNLHELDYVRFINEKDFSKRIYDITTIFIKTLIKYYIDNNLDKNDILNDDEIYKFINLLTKEVYNNVIVPDAKLSSYIYKELSEFIYKDNKIFIR